jgi:hypothetical protein
MPQTPHVERLQRGLLARKSSTTNVLLSSLAFDELRNADHLWCHLSALPSR